LDARAALYEQLARNLCEEAEQEEDEEESEEEGY